MKNETLKKYQDALQGVELRCKMNAKVTNTIIASEYKVGNSFVSYSKQLGYIMPMGRGHYKWCEEAVNRDLAERLLKYTKLKIKKSIDKTKQRHTPSVFEVVKKKTPSIFEVPEEKTEQPKQSKVKPAKTETVSWFWGLYTKTVKG